MEYRNKKTGFSFFSDCKIYGPDWEEVTTVAKEEVEEVLEEDHQVSTPADPPSDTEQVSESELAEAEEQTGNSDYDTLKKQEIIQELQAMGIEHNPRDKKQVLYDLMMGK